MLLRVRACRLPLPSLPWLVSLFIVAASLVVTSGASIAADAPEKQRVPKSEPRHKPSGDSQQKSADEDDSSGILEGCASGCLESCLTGFFESLFSRHAEESAPALQEAPPPGIEAPRPWTVDDRGWLVADAPGDSVVLWRSAFEKGREDVEAGRLPDGSEVMILETHQVGEAIEFRVRPTAGLQPSGWIPAERLSSASLPAPADAAEAPSRPPPPVHDRKPAFENGIPRFAVRVVPGLGIFYNHDLSVEYDEQSLEQASVDVQVLGFSRTAWFMWGVGAGYRQAWGSPAFDYVTAEVVDEPSDSRWREAHVDVQFGQRWRDWKGGILSWSLAPALFHVSERARLRAWRNDSTAAFLGERVERLERWTGGAILRLGAGWQVAPAFELGLQASSYLMAWNGRRERSLAGDFERRPIGGFDIGVALTYTPR